eukprot:TRINITY_DN24609_c0_g1_i1.p1 TRINITY_DN24609_c0_g1~~TRINITY_DN24609_c0_g1_i1.p1  ORF type:complete len:1398 (+),score=403.40 TRINITY_DN24609_c0_g1_i1:43-4194(+)
MDARRSDNSGASSAASLFGMHSRLGGKGQEDRQLNTKHLVVAFKAKKEIRRKSSRGGTAAAVHALIPRLEPHLADAADVFGSNALSEDSFVRALLPWSAGDPDGAPETPDEDEDPFDTDAAATLRYLFNVIDVGGRRAVTWSQLLGFLIDQGMRAAPALDADSGEKTLSLLQGYELEGAGQLRFEGIKRMRWSPEMQRLLSITRDSRLLILDPLTGRTYKDRFEHEVKGRVTALEYVPYLRQIVLASSAGELVFVDLHKSASHRVVSTVQADCTQVAVRWAPRTQRLFTGGRTGEVSIWQVGRGEPKEEQRLHHHKEPITEIIALPLDGSVVTASLDGDIVLQEPRQGRLITRFRGHQAGVTSLAYCVSQNMLVSGGLETEPLLWIVNSGAVPKPFRLHDPDRPHTHPLVAVEAVVGSPQVVSVDTRGMVKLWDVRTFCCVQTLTPWRSHQETWGWDRATHSACWVPGQSGETARLMVCGVGPLLVYGTTKDVANSVRVDEEPVCAIAYHAAGDTLVTAAGNGVRLWTLSTGEIIAAHPNVVAHEISAVCVDSKGRAVTFGTIKGKVSSLDLNTGAPLHDFGAVHAGYEVIGVVSLPGGLLVSCGAGGSVCALSVEAGSSSTVCVFSGVRTVRANPETSWIALAGGRRVEMWDCTSDKLSAWRLGGWFELPKDQNFSAVRQTQDGDDSHVSELLARGSGDVAALCYVPGHAVLVSADWGGRLTLWGVRDPARAVSLYQWQHTVPRAVRRRAKEVLRINSGFGPRVGTMPLDDEDAEEEGETAQSVISLPAHIEVGTGSGGLQLCVGDDGGALTMYNIEQHLARVGTHRRWGSGVQRLPSTFPTPKRAAHWAAHPEGILQMLWIPRHSAVLTTGSDRQGYAWSKGGSLLGCLDQTGQSLSDWRVGEAELLGQGLPADDDSVSLQSVGSEKTAVRGLKAVARTAGFLWGRSQRQEEVEEAPAPAPEPDHVMKARHAARMHRGSRSPARRQKPPKLKDVAKERQQAAKATSALSPLSIDVSTSLPDLESSFASPSSRTPQSELQAMAASVWVRVPAAASPATRRKVTLPPAATPASPPLSPQTPTRPRPQLSPLAAAAAKCLSLSRLFTGGGRVEEKGEDMWSPSAPQSRLSRRGYGSPSSADGRSRQDLLGLIELSAGRSVSAPPPSGPRWQPIKAAPQQAQACPRLQLVPRHPASATATAPAPARLPAQDEHGRHYCPRRHLMVCLNEQLPDEYVGRYEGVRCDLCSSRMLHKREYWHCRRCEIDVCTPCAESSYPRPHAREQPAALAETSRRDAFVPAELRRMRRRFAASAGVRSAVRREERGTPVTASSLGLHAVGIPKQYAAAAVPIMVTTRPPRNPSQSQVALAKAVLSQSAQQQAAAAT